MVSGYDTYQPAYNAPGAARSRFRNRWWMVLLLAIALVFLGVIIWNRTTAPNELLDPIEQGTLPQPQQEVP